MTSGGIPPPDPNNPEQPDPNWQPPPRTAELTLLASSIEARVPIGNFANAGSLADLSAGVLAGKGLDVDAGASK